MENFTDRFIELPIEMFNRKEAELTGDQDRSAFESFGKFNPMQIEGWMPAYDNNNNPDSKTSVYFKSGESVLVLLGIEVFERKLNAFIK